MPNRACASVQSFKSVQSIKILGLCAAGVIAVGAGCSPSTHSVADGGAVQDFGPRVRDMSSCLPPPSNYLLNPDFEAPSSQAADGNGVAKNTGSPASTIPSWDGCCSQGLGGTTWTVTQGMPRCGGRSLSLVSTMATTNVLNQALDLRAQAGRTLRISGWVFVTQADPGASLKLDVFNLGNSALVALTPPQTQTTADWTQLVATGTVPGNDRVQVRINTSGSLSAVVDDLVLTIE